jgi:phosphate transport system substrate-binding protein
VGRVHGRERRHLDRRQQADTWVDCLTTAELKRSGTRLEGEELERHSLDFPDVPLKLFGPGTDSGTFDFFTEKNQRKAKASLRLPCD